MQQAGDDRGPPAAVSPNLSRRVLLGGIGTAVTIAPDRGQDAAIARCASERGTELLRLCDAFMERTHQLKVLQEPYYGTVKGPPADVLEEQYRLVDLGHAIAEEIVWTPASTIGELRAKAEVVSTYVGECPEGEPEAEEPFERLVWSLTRDLAKRVV